MGKIILELSYETKVLYNLEKTWIQPLTMSPGYMLCYEDDEWDRGVIYRSDDKAFLIKLQNKFMHEVSEGKKYIKL